MKGYRLVLSVGHDEYWSVPMRNHLEAFIANGGNVAFFSGNVCYWQVRLENGGQAMVGYKFNFEKDPHFKNENYWFGVTRLRGDRLLRTGPDPATVELSPTCRELFGEAAS